MAFALLFALVGFSTVVALLNWRAGLLLCVLVGIVQDPLRKVTPGTPAYMTLSFLPIYLAMAANLFVSTNLMASVRRYYPQLLPVSGLFVVCLLASAVQTLSYGLNAIPLTMLGLFSYGGGLPALFLGFFYLRKDYTELVRPFMFLAAVTALMMIGTPLEYSGYKFSAHWLGPLTLDSTRRWYSRTEWVEMICGFYRAPEIMGWHAALLVILCLYLMVRRPPTAFLWAPLAVFGSSCVLLSGRRKMLLVILAFLATFLFFSTGMYRRRLVVCLIVASLVIAPLLVYGGLEERYLATAESSLPAAGTRLSEQLFAGPLWLLGNVGLFGYGVGTKSQGAQHLGITIEAPLMEGGFEKIMVELGVAGSLAFLAFLLVLGTCIFQNLQRVRYARLDHGAVAALLAFTAANVAAFAIAFQIYGDPLVVFLVSFTVGLLLSGSRLAEQRWRALRPDSVPAARATAVPAGGVANA